MDSDTINRSFTAVFNKINAEYGAASKEDKLSLNMCIAQARALLDEPAIPRYHRIKTLLLLTNMVGDYDEAYQYHRDADVMLRVVRTQEEPGANPDVDTALAELSDQLEELREILKDEAEADFVAPKKSAKKAAEDIIAARKKRAAASRKDDDELEKADAKAMNLKTPEEREAMKALVLRKAAPETKPPEADPEQTKKMINDWDNVLHQNLAGHKLTNNPAIQALLAELKDALSRNDYQRYALVRVQLNTLTMDLIKSRKAGLEAGKLPHTKAAVGVGNWKGKQKQEVKEDEDEESDSSEEEEIAKAG